METRIAVVLAGIIVLAALLVLSGAVAAAPAQLHIDWYAVAAGGGRAWSSQYVVEGTCGQAATGGASSEGFELGGGFWGGSGVPAVPENRIYLPLILRGHG